jgi:hypothetical protein
MNVETLKEKLKKILGDQVRFNDDFKKYAPQLQNQEDILISWCEDVAERKISPKISKKNKDMIIFIKKIGSSNRCVVIKLKEDKFTECHLGNHKYYDYLRKQIGL